MLNQSAIFGSINFKGNAFGIDVEIQLERDLRELKILD